MIDKKNQRM